MQTILLSILVFLPFVIYVVAVLRKRERGQNPHEFFLAFGKISAREYANTSVAYGFQIASVSIFVAWGYFYGLGAFVNPVFWGVGIFMFSLSLRRIAPFIGTQQTLHGFIGNAYDSRILTLLASLMTLVGFLGAFTAELVWGSYVLSIINPSPLFISICTSIMALFLVAYVSVRGSPRYWAKAAA